MFESLRLIEMLEEIRRNEFRANNWFAYNSIIKTSPVEEPTSQKFESCPSKITQKTTRKSKEDRSSFDIIKGDNEVTITIDMPDTKKENIGLLITKDTIEITTNNPEGKYHILFFSFGLLLIIFITKILHFNLIKFRERYNFSL